MPTRIAIALVAVVGVLVALRGEDPTGNQAGSSAEQVLERFDSALRQGLNQDTHKEVEDRLSGPVSNEFLGVARASAAKLTD